MKYPNRLIYGLRALFGTLRIFQFLYLVIGLPLVLIIERHGSAFGKVRFSDDSFPIRVLQNSADTGTFSVQHLEGVLILKDMSARSELLTFAQWTHFPSRLIGSIFVLLLLHLLWRLCRNAERGEIFTESNVKLVRALGALLIAYTLLSSLANTWSAYRIGHYIDQHLSFEGIKALSALPDSFNFVLEIKQLITGLLVLALAEIFRQGLTLKQDTDLTV